MKGRVIALVFAVLILSPVAASRSTTYTYTPNPRGAGFFTRTGDAYLPEFTFTNLGLQSPEDLFIADDDLMYIADTENKRVVVFDIASGTAVGTVEHESIRMPTGVWKDRAGILYVADPVAKAVLCFNESGRLVKTYERPSAVAYGDRDFAPRKVSVDSAGNLFVISEGVYDGVIQLSPDGLFLGYFTSNKIDLSFVERLQDLLFTEAQKANLLARAPVTFSNLYLDDRNILYTTTIGDETAAVKKHNAAGMAIVEGPSSAESAAVDLWVSRTGIMVVVFADGETIIYTKEGDIIATFGYSYELADVAGLFDTPSAVAMDSRGALWYLDREKSFLQSYQPTPYIQDIYTALDYFDRGEYAASIRVWQEVLKVNQVSQIAHLSIGKNYLFLRDYDRALYHTRIANNREFYAESFWEVRNVWLQRNVIYIVGIIVLLSVLLPVYRLLRRRVPVIIGLEAPFRNFAHRPRVRTLLYQFRVMRHPADSFYEIRAGKEGSIGGAVTILVAFFGVVLAFVAGKGFIFQEVLVEDIDFTSLVLGYVGIIGLFILSNYLGTSINDGRGDMKDLLKMVAYSLAPLWLAMVISVALSYVLTLNEAFAVRIIMAVGWSWWAIQLLVGLRETHDYSTRGAVASVLFSVVFMLIIVVVGVIITVMGQQVWQFFEALVKELIRNVT
jgi:hypothetical protein